MQHSFDDRWLMAGYASMGREILEQVGNERESRRPSESATFIVRFIVKCFCYCDVQ